MLVGNFEGVALVLCVRLVAILENDDGVGIKLVIKHKALEPMINNVNIDEPISKFYYPIALDFLAERFVGLLVFFFLKRFALTFAFMPLSAVGSTF